MRILSMKAKKISKNAAPKKVVLDEFEEQVMKDLEDGKYIDVTTPKLKKELQQIAAYTIEAREGSIPINIRLPAQDLLQLRERAEKEGLPYQTLARSVIHRYVTGQLVDLNHVENFAGAFFEKPKRPESSPEQPKASLKERKAKSA
jgi:predicted DNA binding CopG/RHH family protein